MNNDLNSLILSNAKDKVARLKRNHPIANSRFANFQEMQTQFESNGFGNMLILAHEEAALLAMEELAGFLRWMFIHGYDLSESEKRYTQYLNEKKDEGN